MPLADIAALTGAVKSSAAPTTARTDNREMAWAMACGDWKGWTMWRSRASATRPARAATPSGLFREMNATGSCAPSPASSKPLPRLCANPAIQPAERHRPRCSRISRSAGWPSAAAIRWANGEAEARSLAPMPSRPCSPEIIFLALAEQPPFGRPSCSARRMRQAGPRRREIAMSNCLQFALLNAVAGQDDVLNPWYDEHIHYVVTVPRYLAGQRFE